MYLPMSQMHEPFCWMIPNCLHMVQLVLSGS
jgi:hypothetical protein